jgi:hypothetical protein
MRRWLSLLVALCAALVACGFGTTGDALVTFTPYAAGAAGADQPFSVGDYTVQFTSASMYIGAVYFDESPPSTGFDAPACTASDIFAAQVPGGVTVNLLSTEPQEFSVYGSGSADVALSWDLWLWEGGTNTAPYNDVNVGISTIPTAVLTGTAALTSDPTNVYSFGAIVEINPGESADMAGSRGTPISNPSLPGQNPICKDRILQIGGIDLAFYQGGTLNITIDPRAWFFASGAIDFSQLQPWNTLPCTLSGDDSLDAYETRGPCDSSGACAPGLVCNEQTSNGVPSCVAPCGPGGTCPSGFVCNSADNHCIAEFCIPDTNFPASETTPEAALAGEQLFLGIEQGGGAAYSVSFTGPHSG